MSQSYLQDDFLRVFAEGHKTTAKRISSKFKSLGLTAELHEKMREIIQDELRGLYHGNLVVFDGGSSLADRGLIKIIDDEGVPFVSYLHEIGFKHYDECGSM